MLLNFNPVLIRCSYIFFAGCIAVCARKEASAIFHYHSEMR
jgi:hypothetical protein